MEMNLIIQNMTGGAKTSAPSAGQGQGAPKAAGNGAFETILTQAGSPQQGLDNQEQAVDPLLSMLAALSGGYSPLVLLQLTQNNMPADGEAGVTVHLQVGAQTLPIQLQHVPLTNEELAHVLQQFGATPALMSVLMEQPQGQPVDTLAAHPAMLQDFGSALSQAVEQTSATPQLLTADSKTADLMKAVLAQLTLNAETEQGSATETQQLVTTVKSQRMFGKLQATITTAQALQVTDSSQQAAASETLLKAVSAESLQAQTPASAVGTAQMVQATEITEHAQPTADQADTSLVNAGVANAPQAQVIHRTAQTETVTIRAEKFRDEVQQVVIKHAQLIQAPGRQEFRIILEPHGLGEIEVRIQAEGNQLSVQFTADTATAKGMLDSGLASLKAQLQASGIQFDRIDVTSGSQNSNNDLNSGSGMPQERGQGQNAQDGQGQNNNGQPQRLDLEAFSFDQVEETEAEEAEITPETDSIDVTA